VFGVLFKGVRYPFFCRTAAGCGAAALDRWAERRRLALESQVALHRAIPRHPLHLQNRRLVQTPSGSMGRQPTEYERRR
jgi:hypothetical protein